MGNPHQPILARGAGPGVPTASTEPQGPPERTYLEPNADPDAVVDEILALLGKERFRSARRLAAEALARFPDHARLRRAWAIFDNRGKAKISRGRGPAGLQTPGPTDCRSAWSTTSICERRIGSAPSPGRRVTARPR